MRRSGKVQGGALQFVVFMGTVIAVLLLCFVLLTYTHTFFGQKTDRFVELVKTNESAFRQLLQGTKTGPSSWDEQGIHMQHQSQTWGMYEVHTLRSGFQKQMFERTALTGHGYAGEPPSLYLQDNNRPLVLAGQAGLIGKAFLPPAGIRPGNIGGVGFYGAVPPDHLVAQSQSSLPALDRKELRAEGERTPFKPGMKRKRSFHEPAINISGETVVLEDVTVSGHVIIAATNTIVVRPTATLYDVILQAPEIRIEPGVQGRFQAFATKKIDVGAGAQLGYPSALVLRATTAQEPQIQPQDFKQIRLGPNSYVGGCIVYLDSFEEKAAYPNVHLDATAEVAGEIYSQGPIEVKGRISGSVYTHSFMAMEKGSRYQNHLFEGRINSKELPPTFAGLALNGKTIKKIARWVE